MYRCCQTSNGVYGSSFGKGGIVLFLLFALKRGMIPMFCFGRIVGLEIVASEIPILGYSDLLQIEML